MMMMMLMIQKLWEHLYENYLVWFVEEKAEIGEGNPQFLPTAGILEFTKKESTQRILQQQQHFTNVDKATLTS